MGKQIEFLMDKNTEIEFLKFVEEQELYFFLPNLDKSEGKIRLTEFSEIIKQSYLLFYNEKYGELSCTEVRIKVLESPVIEYMQTYKNESKNQIRRGRLFISSDINFMNDEIKRDFLKEYKNLVSWIKKNVPNQEYVNKGKKYKGYINDEIKRNLMEGYQIPY